MGDSRRTKLEEQYEELAISLLMDDYAEEEGARLWKEFEAAQANGEVPEIPEELDQKCRQLINNSFAKQERKVKLKRTYWAIAKVAVFAFMLTGVLTVTVMSVDALRLPFLNFLMSQSGEYSSVEFVEQGNDEQSQAEDIIGLLERNISNEYELVQQYIVSDGTISICYGNDSGRIITLDSYVSTGIQNVDTEDTEQKTVKLLDYDAVLINRDGYHIIWADEEKQLVYDLFSDGMDEDTFWKMALAVAEWTK